MLKQGSVDREIKSVESEFDMSKQSDSARMQQLLGSLAKNGAPMAKFMWGNVDSLKDTPASIGVDLYKQLKEFHSRYYSAHLMTLVVQAKECLDTLESWAKEIFSSVPNNGLPQPEFTHILNCFDTAVFPKLYQVVPVKNVHRVEVTWHLPCQKHLYSCKPLHYVGWLVGHEGKGSILSYLRARLWALSICAGNSESGWEHNDTGALFSINISLTDEGLLHVYEVLTVMFDYLRMLREAGPVQAVYDEIKIIEDNEFRWKEQVDPSDYVEHLAETMQKYKPADFLRGDTFMRPFDSEVHSAISMVLNALTPGKCNIAVLSRTFDDGSTEFKEELWYKTKYTAHDLPQDYMSRWLDPQLSVDRSELYLPLCNDYIASDFHLIEPDALYNREPKLVRNTDRSRLWYKQDKKFLVPKSYIFLDIVSPVVSASAKSQAMFDLFIDALTHNLQEVAYNAYVAQLEYEFKVTANGMIIKLSGFSHKLAKLFETIVDHISNFDLSSDVFHALKEQLKKNYFNRFIKCEKLANDVRLMLLEHKLWTKVHKHSFLDKFTCADFLAFVSEFKAMYFMEGYIYGNYTLKEALDIEKYVRCRLSSDVLPLSMLPVERVSQLPARDGVVRVKSFHEGDSNSCVVNYYQVGPSNVRGAVTNQLLNMMMEEPCFDALRTREQLGYSVFSSCKTTYGILAIAILVETQASKFSVKKVDEKIEAFLVEFREKLEGCSQEDFDGQRKSLISIKQCDDSHMGEEADRLWAEIVDKTYLFDRLDKEVDELEKLKLDDVRRWFLDALDKNDSRPRKKLSVQVVGYGDNETNSVIESEPFSTLSQSNAVDLSLCQRSSLDCTGLDNKSQDVNRSISPAKPSCDFQHLEVEHNDHGDILAITDLSQYRCSLPLYPVSKLL
ncbi:nardilysin-like isoform X2 [Watersipora subatra]